MIEMVWLDKGEGIKAANSHVSSLAVLASALIDYWVLSLFQNL